MTPTKPDEDIARLIMSRVLAVAVEHYDDGSRTRMHDFVFTLPDGRTGAAEMTTVTDPADREWLGAMRFPRIVAGTKWSFVVRRMGQPVTAREVIEHLNVLAPMAERRSQPDLDVFVLDTALDGIEAVEWFRTAGIDVFVSTTTDHPGRVTFSGDPKWSMVGDSLDPLVAWLEEELANDDQYGSKFDKLDASGCDERHLVLRVDLGNRIPNDVAMMLVERDAELPTRAPSIPSRFVTGLWLLPEFYVCGLVWTADDGWRRIAHED